MIKNTFALVGLLMGLLAGTSHGYQLYVQKDPPAKQAGAINIASGTISVLYSTAATITGNITASSFTSTGQFTSTGYDVMSGSMTLGGAGNSVTVSSNAVLPGTTFYQNGLVRLSVGKAPTCSTINASTATSVTSFSGNNTGLSATITPIGSKVLIWFSGSVDMSAGGTADITVARGNTNLGSAQGFCESTASSRSPCAFIFLDTGATAGASNLYNIQFKANAAGTVTLAVDTTTAVICVEEVY